MLRSIPSHFFSVSSFKERNREKTRRSCQKAQFERSNVMDSTLDTTMNNSRLDIVNL